MQGLLALFSSSRSSLKLSPGLARVCSVSRRFTVVLSSLAKLFLSRVIEGWARPFNKDMSVQRLCISNKCWRGGGKGGRQKGEIGMIKFHSTYLYILKQLKERMCFSHSRECVSVIQENACYKFSFIQGTLMM